MPTEPPPRDSRQSSPNLQDKAALLVEFGSMIYRGLSPDGRLFVAIYESSSVAKPSQKSKYHP